MKALKIVGMSMFAVLTAVGTIVVAPFAVAFGLCRFMFDFAVDPKKMMFA